MFASTVPCWKGTALSREYLNSMSSVDVSFPVNLTNTFEVGVSIRLDLCCSDVSMKIVWLVKRISQRRTDISRHQSAFIHIPSNFWMSNCCVFMIASISWTLSLSQLCIHLSNFNGEICTTYLQIHFFSLLSLSYKRTSTWCKKITQSTHSGTPTFIVETSKNGVHI